MPLDPENTWNRARDALWRWHDDRAELRDEHAKILADPEVRSRAAECRRVLVCERTGAARRCGGAAHVAYIRLGSKGRWTRVGMICRHCGHYTPDEPPQHERDGQRLRTAGPEEQERWRQALAEALHLDDALDDG